jgi:CRISPR-associated protein Cas2
MMTLVIYDISDDDDRGKLSNMLFDFGLQRIQYSGFKGDLNAHNRHILAKGITQYVTGEHDSIYVLPLCNNCVAICQIVSAKGAVFVDKSHVRIA